MIPRSRKNLIISLLAVVVIAGAIFPIGANHANALFGIDSGWFFWPVHLGKDAGHIIIDSHDAAVDTITSGATTVDAGVNSAKLVIDGAPPQTALVDTLINPKVCDAYSNANILLDTLDSIGNALAGADKANLSNTFFINYKVESTRSQLRDCWIPLETIANGISTGVQLSNTQVRNLEANRALIAGKKQTLTLQLTDYEKQKKQSFQDLFEAIGYNVGMEGFRAVSIAGINEVIDKMKADLPYVDALATQLYSIDYIKKNYSGDTQRELIAASLFKNKAFNDLTGLDNAVSFAKQKASQYRVDTTKLDWGSNDFWGQVAGAADERVWPQTHMFVGLADSQQALLNGKNSAQQDVNNGKGFKGLYDCTDVSALQAKIDADLIAANKKVEEAELTLKYLRAASALNSAQYAADLKAAEEAYRAAVAAAAEVQKRSSGGLAKPCEALKQPGSFIADTATKWMDGLLNQHMDVTAAKTNVSLWATLAGKLGKMVFTDLINGNGGVSIKDVGKNFLGLSISSGLQNVLNTHSGSGGVLTGGGTGGGNTGGSGLPTIGDGATLTFTSTKNNNQLTLNLKFETSDQIVPKSFKVVAQYVDNTSQGYTDSVPISASDYTTANGLITGTIHLDSPMPTKKTKYTVTFQGLKKSVGVTLFDLVTASLTVDPSVAGAYTAVPSTTFLPRGPETGMLPDAAYYRYY